MWRGSRIICMVNFALKAGSSKQGKAARAKVASNWVDARTLKKANLVISWFHLQALSETFTWKRAAHSPDLPTAGAVAAFVEPMEAVGQVGGKPQQHLVRPAFGQEGV